MPTNLREIINVNFVLLNHGLLSNNAQIQEFEQAVDADVRLEGGMATNVLTGETHPSRTLHLDRDRIVLNLSQLRSTIMREFPLLNSLDEELSRFAEVAEQALSATGLSEVTFDFGYNADMVFDQDAEDTALGFLGNRLLNGRIFSQSGRELVGGTCKVIVEDDSGQWNYTFEPRAGDLQRRRVFVATNLHNIQQPLPDGTAISSSISKVVGNVKDLMSRLDE
jgi:hypothetical protein